MYALDLDDGALIWSFQTADAAGATYGPIVSSAAVAEASIPGRGHTRLVIFGAGPHIYALDATTGQPVWETPVGAGFPGEPAEVESSPLVWGDKVYVGRDVHNQPGDQTGGVRGGLLELDLPTGVLTWTYEPEAAAGQPPSGCGGIWGSPVVDVETGLLYFGSANCPAVNDSPALPMEEITAIELATHQARWTFRPHQPPGAFSCHRTRRL